MMPVRKSNLAAIAVGLYDKALPPALTWHERLRTADQAGYDFLEISIDDSDRRIARLDWKAQERDGVSRARFLSSLERAFEWAVFDSELLSSLRSCSRRHNPSTGSGQVLERLCYILD